MYLLVSKFRFLEFRSLLSQVAPYYSSLSRTVGLYENDVFFANIISEVIYNNFHKTTIVVLGL